MKKLVALLLAALMVTSMVACNSKPEETKAPETTKAEADDTKPADEPTGETEADLVFMWWGNQVRTERTNAVLDMYAEAHPGVTFDRQAVDWSNYWTVLSTKNAGNEMPDLVQMDYKYIAQYAETDALVDLTPYYESGAIDVTNVEQTILNTGKVGEGYYGICNGTNFPALLYNKNVVEEAGVTLNDNITMEEFIEAAQTITDKTGVGARLQYRAETLLQHYLRGLGSKMFNATNDGLGCTEDELVKYFSLFEDGTADGWMMDITYLADVDVNAVEQDPLVYFSSPAAQSWMSLCWSNQIDAYTNAAPEDMKGNIGVLTWPGVDPVKANFIKPSQFFSIGADTEHADVCADVLNFLTNSVECNEVLLAERGIPVSSTVAEAIADKLSDGNKMAIDYLNNVVAKNCSDIDPAAPATGAEFYKLIDQLTEEVCYGVTTAEDAAAKCMEDGEAIIKGE